MKRIIVTVIIIAVVTIMAFLRFFPAKASPLFSITGSWQIDSIYAAKPVDDSIQQRIDVQNTALTKERWVYRFAADSTLTRLSTKDTSIEKYYVADSLLHIHDGRGFQSYALRDKNDTLVSFVTNENIVYLLKKQ